MVNCIAHNDMDKKIVWRINRSLLFSFYSILSSCSAFLVHQASGDFACM